MRHLVLLVAAGCANTPSDPDPASADDGGATPSPEAGVPDARPPEARDAAGAPEGSATADATADASAFAHDTPPFTNGPELCAWLNVQRQGYQPHDRWRGLPVSGEYHTNVTWPIQLAIDPALSARADAEARRVATGGSPAGTPIQLNFNKTLWFDGVSTASYTVTSRDVPGDWVAAPFTGDFTAGLTTGNPGARMGLYYQDPGGAGPVLTRVGCGGALAPDGASRVWVIAFGP
jgi:hypothetical protein